MTNARTLASSSCRPLASLLAAALLLAGGCTSDPAPAGGQGGAPATGGRSGTGGSGAGSGGSPAGDAGAETAPPARSYQRCEENKQAGEFSVVLAEAFTGVTVGQVWDKPPVLDKHKTVGTFGACRLVQPPTQLPPCDPRCKTSEICTATGCVVAPTLQDLGTVSISGLKVPLTLREIDKRYSNPAEVTIPHPGFNEGDPLTLAATGNNGYGPFSATAWGVSALATATSRLVVENDKPVAITWTPPALAGYTKVLIDFTINRHGAVDTNLVCEVPDTGAYTVEAALIKEVFKYGVSGYPVLSLVRTSAGITNVKSGCVEFVVTSGAEREIEVPGYISCSKNEDCPAGKTCGGDLLCK